MSLTGTMLKHALLRPLRLAAVDDLRQYSFGRMGFGAFVLADVIRRETSAKHVGLMLPTTGVFPIALLATWILGRVGVPLNYLLSKGELQQVIEHSDIDTIFTVQAMLDHVGEDAIPEHINVVRLEKTKRPRFPTPRWPASPSADDLAVILYTSGTSGTPKGVMLTHGNLESNVRAAVEHAGLSSADGFLGVLPQFHSFGLTGLTLIPLAMGAKVVYSARFVPKRIVELIRQHKPEVFMAVPSMYGALLSVKDAKPEDFDSLRYPISGGEPLPDAVYERCQQRFNLELLEGYGLTETSPVTHWSTPKKHKRYSVGTALPGVRTFILDDNENVLGPDTEGEIAIAGPNVMAGYYKQPDLTDEVVRQITDPDTGESVRAFKTGDMGRVDEEGYLFITGRKKEMLIIGGENVFPREIEEVLNRHEAIHDAAVIGEQDDVRGEVPIAFVEVAEDHELDAAAIRAYCREHLAAYKVPRRVTAVEELPRSPTGKILRRHLKPEDAPKG